MRKTGASLYSKGDWRQLGGNGENIAGHRGFFLHSLTVDCFVNREKAALARIFHFQYRPLNVLLWKP